MLKSYRTRAITQVGEERPPQLSFRCHVKEISKHGSISKAGGSNHKGLTRLECRFRTKGVPDISIQPPTAQVDGRVHVDLDEQVTPAPSLQAGNAASAESEHLAGLRARRDHDGSLRSREAVEADLGGGGLRLLPHGAQEGGHAVEEGAPRRVDQSLQRRVVDLDASAGDLRGDGLQEQPLGVARQERRS